MLLRCLRHNIKMNSHFIIQAPQPQGFEFFQIYLFHPLIESQSTHMSILLVISNYICKSLGAIWI